MYLTDIIFEPLREDCEPEGFYDAVECYLIGLQKNWQIEGAYTMGWVGVAVRASVNLALPDALSAKFNSEYTSKHLESLLELSQPPSWTVHEDSDREDRRSWRGEKTLYLYTHMFDVYSPICAGSNGRPIPPYLLPLSTGQIESIYSWAGSYRCHDDLQISCGALEIPAYKELATPGSELSQKGRAICREIEAATKLPTYYYVMRYWGRREGEENRVCPSCGGFWKNETATEHVGGLDWFEFRCDDCRLVSHLASSFEDERHARIGEFRGFV